MICSLTKRKVKVRENCQYKISISYKGIKSIKYQVSQVCDKSYGSKILKVKTLDR